MTSSIIFIRRDVTFIAMIVLLFVMFLLTNFLFSVYQSSENRPIVVVSKHSKAVVSLLTLASHEAEGLSFNYTTSLCKLAVSFKARGGHSHDFVLLVVGQTISKKEFHMLRLAGWTIVPVEGIGSPLIYSFESNKYTLAQMYSKLQIWRLTSYEHVVYLDSDTVVLRDPMPALEKAYELVKDDCPGMVIDLGFCWDFYYNAGVMVVRPSVEVFRELLFYRNWKFHSPGMAEQEFLNKYYYDRIVALPRELNVPAYYQGNVSCSLIDADKAVIGHYNGETKPWLTNCTSHPVCRYWHTVPLF
jgi:alpha-N-acetylglucosamine transferase